MLLLSSFFIEESINCNIQRQEMSVKTRFARLLVVGTSARCHFFLQYIKTSNGQKQNEVDTANVTCIDTDLVSTCISIKLEKDIKAQN